MFFLYGVQVFKKRIEYRRRNKRIGFHLDVMQSKWPGAGRLGWSGKAAARVEVIDEGNAAQLRAYLNEAGYPDHHIEGYVRHLAEVGFIHPRTAETLGLRFTRKERLILLDIHKFVWDRAVAKANHPGSSGCAGIFVALMSLMGLAMSVL